MRKPGDKVKIRSKEWINAQNKDDDGFFMAGKVIMVFPQFDYAGREATIVRVDDYVIILDIDDGKWLWSEEMLEEVKDGE